MKKILFFLLLSHFAYTQNSMQRNIDRFKIELMKDNHDSVQVDILEIASSPLITVLMLSLDYSFQKLVEYKTEDNPLYQ